MKTLNLPKTDFSQKAESKTTEPKFNQLWKEQDVFNKRNLLNSEPFVLHDGPPYANGRPHVGHMLNKLLKDTVVKYKLLSGYKVDYTPGWDCHGLPTELLVQKEFGQLPTNELREKCSEHAEHFMNVQRDEFVKLGLFGNYDKPYLTMDKDYESKQLEAFYKMYKKGFVYRDERPVYYSPSTQTVLAEAELEYKDRTDKSTYFKFPCGDFELLVWTTMPWTLPGNKAVCVHPDLTYVVKNALLVAESRSHLVKGDVTQTFQGSDLEGLEYTNPLNGETNKVVMDSFVTDSDGTGMVHLCPAHGDEDFRVCSKYGVSPKLLTDKDGNYLTNGLYVLGDGTEWVLDEMKKVGMLHSVTDVVHSYPHDWRTDKPVLFMLTKQFFLNLPDLTDTFKEFKKVDWSKNSYKNRMANMLKSRSTWCMSRQRKWGFPVTVFLRGDEMLFDEKVLNHLLPLFEQYGSNCYFDMSSDELLPSEYRGQGWEKSEDTMDVWLDSGLSWHNSLGKDADLYFEGSDQHRGFFQSSLLTSMMLQGCAPYKKVLTHGFVLDQYGKKMSKSKGNVVDHNKYLDMYNADVLRLWTLSVDYTNDVNVGNEVMGTMAKVYFKLRNNFKYLLGNLNDYNTDYKPVNMCDKDKKALTNLENYLNKLKKSYDTYDFRNLFNLTTSYVSNNSKQYFDLETKELLYEGQVDSTERRNRQFVMNKMLSELNKWMAPMVPYLCEDVYQHRFKSGSVFFEDL